MSLPELSLMIVTFLGAFSAGTLCLVWPEKVEKYAREHHLGSPLTQNLLFFSTVRKLWDHKYFLPGMGLVAWSVALGVAYVSIVPK
jgi:hypothetical protein